MNRTIIIIPSRMAASRLKGKPLLDIIVEHTHPTGTGPSGPPMPPASVKLPLLKSLKIGMSLE